MLHEILLSLSGHPSPLFDAQGGGADLSLPLSPPEQALLQTIGRLSRLHRDLRSQVAQICSSHKSSVARAVATAILTVHLARFQEKILDVEAKILKRDASRVGAYNIVPLAGVVGEFDEWTRRIDWYWTIACFIQSVPESKQGQAVPKSDGEAVPKSDDEAVPKSDYEAIPKSRDGGIGCTSASLINKLRQEAQTGYPDIEEVALDLSKVAEKAWLRQLSSWVLYGRLPVANANDFFIYQIDNREYESNSSLLPRFVSQDTAASILFIGKSLNTIRTRSKLDELGKQPVSDTDLIPIHLKELTKLTLPIAPAVLSNAISKIRLSLSRNTLQQLLPLPSVIKLIVLLRDYFLLRNGEFALSLIKEADAALRSRSQPSKTPRSIKVMALKDAELVSILNKTFSSLAIHEDDENSDSLFDFARSLLCLQAVKSGSARPATPGRARANQDLPDLASTKFNDFLLPIPTAVSMEISAPFDLFVTTAEIGIYSSLQSYILAVRRGHLRLSSLWQQASLRRTHPAAPGPPISLKPHVRKQAKFTRDRVARRRRDMRAVWATCSAAVFLLAEIGNYFEGEVIDGAWTHFRDWITQDNVAESRSRRNSSCSERRIACDLESLAVGEESTPHDPAILTSAHRRFLASLSHSLLLTDHAFTTTMHTLLRNIDALTALLTRLSSIQNSLDLEVDEGIVDPLSNAAAEEQDVKRELGRARDRVDIGLRGVVGRLRELVGQPGEDVDLDGGDDEGFVPWKGAGVERLLMRVEAGRGTGGGDDDLDGDDT